MVNISFLRNYISMLNANIHVFQFLKSLKLTRTSRLMFRRISQMTRPKHKICLSKYQRMFSKIINESRLPISTYRAYYALSSAHCTKLFATCQFLVLWHSIHTVCLVNFEEACYATSGRDLLYLTVMTGWKLSKRPAQRRLEKVSAHWTLRQSSPPEISKDQTDIYW